MSCVAAPLSVGDNFNEQNHAHDPNQQEAEVDQENNKPQVKVEPSTNSSSGTDQPSNPSANTWSPKKGAATTPTTAFNHSGVGQKRPLETSPPGLSGTSEPAVKKVKQQEQPPMEDSSCAPTSWRVEPSESEERTFVGSEMCTAHTDFCLVEFTREVIHGDEREYVYVDAPNDLIDFINSRVAMHPETSDRIFLTRQTLSVDNGTSRKQCHSRFYGVPKGCLNNTESCTQREVYRIISEHGWMGHQPASQSMLFTKNKA